MQDMTIVPDGEKWKFDDQVAAVFDNMLARSIPRYDDMRELTYKVGRNYIRPNTTIVDIGCSNGLSAEPFVNHENDIHLYDISEPMLAAAQARFSNNARVSVRRHDLREGIQDTNVSLILSVLTLQFTPIEYRQQILQSLYKALIPGGALILVEKVLGATARLNNMFVREYYAVKKENSYTQKQISSKRKSLEGVLVPVTAKWNEDLMTGAGFSEIECFWRTLNFAGWVAIK